MSNKQKLNIEALKTAIEMVGGLSNLALKSNVSYQSIIDWKSGRKSPNIESCVKIQEATGKKVTCKDLLPDYPWDKTQADAIKDEKSQIAKNLLAAGVDIDTIAKTTGISVEELKK